MNPPPSRPPYPDSGVATQLTRIDKVPDDATLLQRMAEGDEQALGTFYDRWSALVHGVVLRILRQRDDVEDTVEEVFWQAWRQAGRYEPSRGAVQTWLLTIARSRALDRVRALKRLREEPLEGDNGEMLVQQTADGDASTDAESSERRQIEVRHLPSFPRNSGKRWNWAISWG